MKGAAEGQARRAAANWTGLWREASSGGRCSSRACHPQPAPHAAKVERPLRQNRMEHLLHMHPNDGVLGVDGRVQGQLQDVSRLFQAAALCLLAFPGGVFWRPFVRETSCLKRLFVAAAWRLWGPLRRVVLWAHQSRRRRLAVMKLEMDISRLKFEQNIRDAAPN